MFNHRFQQIAVHARREPGRISTHDQHVAPKKFSGVELKVEELPRHASCCIGDHTRQWAEAIVVGRGIQGTRVLMGPPGLGQWHLVQAIGYQAIKTGLIVLYRPIFDGANSIPMARLSPGTKLPGIGIARN